MMNECDSVELTMQEAIDMALEKSKAMVELIVPIMDTLVDFANALIDSLRVWYESLPDEVLAKIEEMIEEDVDESE